MTRNQLLEQLTALDFMAVDLNLFLDTHPTDCMAIDQYNEIMAKANILRNEYERVCGPLTAGRTPAACPWEWVEDPWPWQYSFNFNLTKDGGN